MKVGIDLSKNCSAMYIDAGTKQHIFVYANSKVGLNKSGLNVHFESVKFQVKLRFFGEYRNHDWNDVEYFNRIAGAIIADLESICKAGSTRVNIEGYNMGLKGGRITDLVSIGAIVRCKVLDAGFTYLNVPPSSLKQFVGEVCYPSNKEVKNKKIIYRNNQGKASGMFTKHDIARALIESNFNDKWAKFFGGRGGLLSAKSIPNPYEDINDALFLSKM